ncbi:MAG: glycosyltransferase family 9 protein [Thermodesulfobacteriota bacterium]
MVARSAEQAPAVSKPAVLAACTTAIGDTVLCTPALVALGQVYAVDVLVHQHRLPLLEGNPFLRQLLPYRNNPLQRVILATRLAPRRYEHVIVLHANHDLVQLLPFLRYRDAVNIQGWNLPRQRMTELSVTEGRHVVHKRLEMAHWAGAQTHPDHPWMRVFLSAQELDQAEAWLTARGMPAERPRVGMVLGASHVFKRWPAERFGRVAAALRRQGAEVLLIGGKHELYLAELANRAAGGGLKDGHELGMRQLAAVLARLDILVSNDTGPLHLAQAVDTPVLGLFGPTDPITIGPRGPMHGYIKVPVTCDPCLTKTCPDAKCLLAMEEGQVLAEVERMLARPQYRLENRS